jgi:pimeloyl-ACP methyl ester carboxylesterase
MFKDEHGHQHPRAYTRRGLMALMLSAVLFASLWLGTFNPAATVAANRTPVIFIPGTTVSEFAAVTNFTYNGPNGRGGTYTHNYFAGEKVWVNAAAVILDGEDDYFDALRLTTDGDTPYIPDSKLGVSGIPSLAYNNLLDYLRRQGYVDGVTLFVFPYDWRRDIQNATYAKLDNLVNQARAAAGTTQVDLVGHSMGGLVAKNYISYPSTAAKVRRMINFGSPYLGAPGIFKTLLYGDNFGLSFFGVGVNSEEIKDLVQNMGGNWQLLSSRAYYNFYTNANGNLLSTYKEDRDVDGDGVARGVMNYTNIFNFLRNMGKNQNAANRAQAFHDRLDNLWGAGPRVSLINGSGLATLGQIRDYTGSCWNWFGYKPCPKTDTYTVDGDGTVTYYSATPYDPSRGLDYTGPASIHLVNRDHGKLVEYDYILGIKSGDGPGLSLLGQILNNQVDPLLPVVASSNERLGLIKTNKDKLKTTRPKLQGYWLGVTDGAQVEILDEKGNRTGRKPGKNSAVETGVEGVRVETLGGSEFVYLPTNKRLNLRITADKTGSYDLKIRKLNGDCIEATALYLNVPVSAGEVTEIEFNGFDNKGNAPTLAKGKNMAQATNFQPIILDASASLDQDAPEIRISAVRPALRGITRLMWSATDGLAGLHLEQGVLNPDSANPQLVKNGETLQLAPGQYTLQVLAQDRAGNTSVRDVKFTVAGSNDNERGR